MHMMAFEFLGGHAHCGEPWHKFGAPYALKDCEDHEPNGCAAVLETGLGGDPCHDTGGWPNFDGWPDYHSLTHESSYYRWLERAHLGGLRIFVNLMVENRVLCEIYPDMSVVQGEPKTNCDEMDTVRRENAADRAARGLHRRAGRRTGQGLLPHRRDARSRRARRSTRASSR